MTERPMLFRAPMVLAILDGSKTQTRRVVKLPVEYSSRWSGGWHIIGKAATIAVEMFNQLRGTPLGTDPTLCPYGQPGDRLWVRETWGVVSNDWDENGNLIDWVPDRPATAISEMPFGQGYYSGHAIYAADGAYEWADDDDGGGEPRTAWHPSIHMPRAASRIMLEIVSVRVERLQDISDADAQAEGARRFDDIPLGTPSANPCRWSMESPANTDQCLSTARYAFANLFSKVNGKGKRGVLNTEAWDTNPWVWVVEFVKVNP